MRLNPRKVTIFFVIIIAISSANNWTTLPIGNTTFWWIIYALFIISFISAKKYLFNSIDNSNILFLKLYLFWNIVCIFRGCFVADNYWEWKNLLSAGMVLLIPLSINISTNREFIQYVFVSYLKYAIFVFILLFSFLYADASGQFLAPISILLLFFFIISPKWKIGLLLIYFLVIISDLDARSNVIKFTVPLLLSIIYYVPKSLIKIGKILEFARLTLMIIPIVFFTLGITGVFNVFKIDKYVKGNYETTKIQNGEIVGGNLTSDTRTFLYTEVLQSAVKFDYVIFGRTPARGNESKSFGAHLADELKTGRLERFGNEVSILNVFTWTGLIGVILYFLVFFKSTYLAINRSNNIFIKIIGIYVSFRWVYAWIEDFSRIDLYSCFLWILIGMCCSIKFRQMNDQEMKIWIRGIFDSKYRIAYHKQLRKTES